MPIVSECFFPVELFEIKSSLLLVTKSMQCKERYSHFQAEKRPREQLLAFGAEKLSDMELIAVLLGSGSRERPVWKIAEEVLRVFDSLDDNFRADEFLRISGIGTAKAALLSAALELSRRKLCPGKKKISFPSDVYPLLTHYVDRDQENFFSLSLNGAHEVKSVRLVTKGLLNRTIVHPREVFAQSVAERAAALIVAHNHPSGNLQPSHEDREITQRLKQSGEILGIQLLDHIIFGEEGYYSFLEEGEL